MKKVILIANLLVIITCISFNLKAQVSKGTMSVGGGIYYRNLKYQIGSQQSSKGEFLSFSPGFDYFIQDRLALGINLGIGFSKFENVDQQIKYSYPDYSFNPYVRYYLPIVEGKLYAFGEGGLRVTFTKTFMDYNFNNVNTSAFSVNAAPGMIYFIKSNLAIETEFSLLNFSFQNPEGEGNNTSSFSLGFDSLIPNLGFRFFF